MAGMHDFKSTNATGLNFGPHFSTITQSQINQDPGRYSTPIVSINTQVGDHEEILSLAAVKVVIDWSTGKPLLLDHTERYYKPPVKTGKLNNTQGPGHEYGQRTYNQHKLNVKALDDLRRKSGMPSSVTEFNSDEERGLRAWAGQNVTWASHNFNAFTSRHLLKYNTMGQSSIDTYAAAVNKYGLPRANPINPVNQNKELYNLYRKATGRNMKSAGLSEFDAMSHAVADVTVLMALANTKGESGAAIRYILQHQNTHNVGPNKFGFGSQVVQGNFHLWDSKVDPGFLGPTRVGSVTSRNYLPRGQYNMTGWPTTGGNGPMPTPTPGMFPPNWGDLMTKNTDAALMLAASNEPLGRTSVLNMAKSLIDASKPSWRNFNAIDFFKQMMPGLSNRGAKRFTEQGIKLKEASEAATLAASNLALDAGVYQGKYNESIAQSMGFVNGIDDVKALKQGVDRTNAIWELGERTKMHNNLSMLATQGKIDSGSVSRLESMMPGSLEQNQAIWREERNRGFRNEVKEARRHNRIRHDDYVELMNMEGDSKGRKAFDDAVKSLSDFNKGLKNAAKATDAFISSFHSQFFDPRQLVGASEQGAQGAIQRLDFLPRSVTKPAQRLTDAVHRIMDIQLSGIGRAIDTWKGIGGNVQNIGGILGGGLGFAVSGGNPAGAMFGSAIGQLPGLGINIASQIRGQSQMKQINNFWKDLQMRFDMLGMVVDIVSVPFKLLAKAAQSLIGMFKGLGVSLSRFVTDTVSKLNQLITPLTGLTGVTTQESQRLNILDKFFGFGQGSINSAIESWSAAGQAVYTLGQIDESKIVPAFTTSLGGEAGGAWLNGDYKGIANMFLSAKEVTPSDYMDLMKLDPQLARIVQQGRNMGFTSIDQMMPGNFTYNTGHGVIRPDQHEIVEPGLFEHMQQAGFSYAIMSQGIANSQKRFAVQIWDLFGAELYSGFNNALDKLVREHDWQGAWSIMTKSISSSTKKIREALSGLMFKGDITKGWKDIIGEVWSKIKTGILGWAEDDTFFGKIREGFSKIVDAVLPAARALGHMWIDFVFDLIEQLRKPINDLLNSLGDLQVSPDALFNWVTGKGSLSDAFGIKGTGSEFAKGVKTTLQLPGWSQTEYTSFLKERTKINNGYSQTIKGEKGDTLLDIYSKNLGILWDYTQAHRDNMVQDMSSGGYAVATLTTPNGKKIPFYTTPGIKTFEDLVRLNQGKGVFDEFIHATTGKTYTEYLHAGDTDKLRELTHETWDSTVDFGEQAGKSAMKIGGEYGKKVAAEIDKKLAPNKKTVNGSGPFDYLTSEASDIADDYTEKETMAGGTMGTPIYVTAAFDFGDTKVVLNGDATRNHTYRPDSDATEDILLGFAKRLSFQGEIS